MNKQLTRYLISAILMVFAFYPNVQAQLSGVWSGSGNTWRTTTTDGLVITATYSGQVPKDISPDRMGCVSSSYSEPGVVGQPSLFHIDDKTKPTTLVFTFSEYVENPVINIDKLGNRKNSSIGSTLITLVDGNTWTQLSSNGSHFVSTSTTARRAVTTSDNFSVECGTNAGNSLGSATGSLRINGTVNRIELRLTDGGGSYELDEHEFSFSGLSISNKGRITCASGNPTFTGGFVANGTPQSGNLTIPISVVKSGEICFNLTGTGFSSSSNPYCTTVTSSQTSITIPVNYNGQGSAGTRTLNYYSPDGCAGSIAVTINQNCSNTPLGGTASLEQAGAVCSTQNTGIINLSGQNGNVVRWETSTNGTTWATVNNTSGLVSYTFNNAVNGQQFRAVVTTGSGCGEVNSTPVVISANPTVCCPNPSSAGTLAYSGGVLCTTSANGTITLSGHNGNIVWETSTNNGASWSAISGANVASFSFSNAVNGQQYRVRVTATGATCTPATSNVITINTSSASCCPVPAIGGTLDKVPAGALCATYARGTITLSGQDGTITGWQTSVNGGGTWTDIANTASLTSFTFSGAQNNQQYRVKVEKPGCSVTYSEVESIVTSSTACTFSTVCDSENGTVTIARTTPPSGSALASRLVAVDSLGKIVAVSAINALNIANVPSGSYMVYEVSYDTGSAPALTIGSAFSVSETSCIKVSNPVPYKVCVECTPQTPLSSVSTSQTLTMQAGKDSVFTVSGGTPGAITWAVTPTTGVTPSTSGVGNYTPPLKFNETGAYKLTFISVNAKSPLGCNIPDTTRFVYDIAVIPPIPCDPVIPGQIETFAASGLTTGNSAYFVYTPSSPNNVVTWQIIPATSAVPGSGTGSQTPLIVFTNQGEYEIVFSETNSGSPVNCGIPSTGHSSVKFIINNNPQNCPTPGAANITIAPTSAAIAPGGTGNFVMTGGQPYQNVQWFITPQQGVSPAVTGTGTNTGNLVFANQGIYRATFVYTNAGDLTCNPVQRVASGLIAVGMNPCTPPSPITVFNQTPGDVVTVGSTRTFTAQGGVPGLMSWKVFPASGASPSSGTGSTANINFTEGGKYVVTFTSTNGSIPLGCTSPVSVSSSKEIVVEGNVPPELAPNPVITKENEPKTICMPFTDLNEADIHNVQICEQGTKGNSTVTINQANKTVCLTYTPNPGETGTDEVCIRLCDGTASYSECVEYIIPVTIIPAPDPVTTPQPPVIVPTPMVTYPGTPVTQCVEIVDPNVGDTFTAQLCSPQAVKGTVTTVVNGNNLCITYTPNPNQVGQDEVCVRVCDNTGLCFNAPVPVTILDTNYRGPKLTPQTIVTPENTPVTQCAPVEFESDGGILNATMCGAPTKGTITNITISEDQDRLCYTFTPNPGQTGIDEVCFEVCHGAICDQKIFPIYIIPSVPTNTPVYNPDNNVTYVNVPVPGNVKTNDKDVKPGTTYGTPVPVAGNPANCVPTMTPASGNTTGAYTFTCATPGVYKFTVPVCEASPSTTCTNVPLVITVLDNTTPANNGPVANNDYGTTPQNTPVTLPTLVNDKPGNSTTNLVPGSVTVTTSPTNGTATVNPTTGNITYTPNPGFTGTDVLTYQMCDNASPAKCATAQQVITVRPTGSPNTTEAVDDYYSTPKDTPVSGNVKTNDRDPEGNTQTVTPQNTTSPGKGTLVLNNDGTFTFTPVTGYTGPVSFPYTTCDNGTPQACANATLYIMITDVPTNTPVYNPDNNVTYVNVPVPGNVKTNDKDVKPGTTYGTPVPVAGNPANCVPTMTPASGNTTGAYTFTCATPGVYKFTVPVCEASPSTTCTNVPLVITVLDNTTPANNGPVANNDYGTTPQNTPVTLPTLVNDKPGNSTTNLVPGSVTVTTSPTNGTATVNPTTGNITYTPNPGFTGTDVLTYQVCDNASPAKCATAQQVITVRPTGSPNTTEAVDDYYSTPKDTPVSGNVKTNDRDPEGNTQTVTPQNTTSPGKGTLVLNNDGTFTFTPVTGYTGPVSFPYTTCDNGTPQACANATLYITVADVTPVCIPDLNPAIEVVPGSGVSGSVRMGIQVDVKELLGCNTDPTKPIRITVSKSPNFTFNWAGFANSTSIPYFDFTGLENSDWTFTETGSLYIWTYNKPVFSANGISNIGFEGTWNAGTATGTQNFTVTIINGSGGEVRFGNNLDVARVRHTAP